MSIQNAAKKLVESVYNDIRLGVKITPQTIDAVRALDQALVTQENDRAKYSVQAYVCVKRTLTLEARQPERVYDDTFTGGHVKYRTVNAVFEPGDKFRVTARNNSFIFGESCCPARLQVKFGWNSFNRNWRFLKPSELPEQKKAFMAHNAKEAKEAEESEREKGV
jgi:hypothetical protein